MHAMFLLLCLAFHVFIPFIKNKISDSGSEERTGKFFEREKSVLGLSWEPRKLRVAEVSFACWNDDTTSDMVAFVCCFDQYIHEKNLIAEDKKNWKNLISFMPEFLQESYKISKKSRTIFWDGIELQNINKRLKIFYF